MIDLQNPDYCPSLEELYGYVRNPLFLQFCSEISKKYQISPQPEFSKCSWIPGWNLKFKKFGKTLCTIYPKENYFTVLVVVGKKEKEPTEALLPECSSEMQEVYRQTKEGNGQRWLMIDLEDEDELYADVLGLIEIRRYNK